MKRQYKGLTSYQVRRVNREWFVYQVSRCIWDDYIFLEEKFVKCETRSSANYCADELDFTGYGYKEGDILEICSKYGEVVNEKQFGCKEYAQDI